MTYRALGWALSVLLAFSVIACNSGNDAPEDEGSTVDSGVQAAEGSEESQQPPANDPVDDGEPEETNGQEGASAEPPVQSVPSVDTNLPAYPGATAVKVNAEDYAGASRVALMRTKDSIKKVYDYYKPKVEKNSGALGENAAYLSGFYKEAMVDITISTAESGETEIQILEVD